MVRQTDLQNIEPGHNYKEFSGKSTDVKPTDGLATGSTFFEIDTLDVYFWDEDTGSWLKAGD